MDCTGYARIIRVAVCLPALIAFSAVGMSAQTPSAAAIQAFADSAAAVAMQKGPLPSLSVAVVRGSQTLLAKGYGDADLENNVQATPASVYEIGSNTKQFTAAAIMRLVEQGKLHLDDDIKQFFPNFPFGDRHVTVYELLTHTSGVANYTMHLTDFERENLPHDSLLAKIYDKPFDFEPGTSYRYSNTGYYMLGMIVEQVSGRPYKEYVQQEFFTPLGLTHTYYCNVEPLIEHRAHGYGVKDGKFVNADYIDMDLPFAAGSICSTTGDLVKWSEALESGKVVSAASYRQMSTPGHYKDGKQIVAGRPGSKTSYGFGLMISDIDGHRSVSHGGGINGFESSLETYPDDSLYIVVLTNVLSAPGAAQMGQFTQGLTRFVLGLPPAPPRAPRQPSGSTPSTKPGH